MSPLQWADRAEYFRVKKFHGRHPKLDSPIGPHYWEPSDFFIFFKISEHRAIKTWAHFYKIKNFKIASYDNMSLTKVVLLFIYWKKKIIFGELQLIFDTKNWVWKLKNALFWWLRALSFCQIWKNLLVPINVDLKDYLILGASLGNLFPWITIPYYIAQKQL